jgi:hypothetical protein
MRLTFEDSMGGGFVERREEILDISPGRESAAFFEE